MLVPCAQYGSTPLHCAAEKGHAPVVTLLLERGANKEAKDIVRSARARAAAHNCRALSSTRRHAAVAVAVAAICASAAATTKPCVRQFVAVARSASLCCARLRTVAR
jgi:hypothetical protein